MFPHKYPVSREFFYLNILHSPQNPLCDLSVEHGAKTLALDFTD